MDELPKIEWQHIGRNTEAARFGAGYLVRVDGEDAEGGYLPSVTYVPNSLSRINEPEECRDGSCGYMEYLSRTDGIDMPHEAFHATEAEARRHMDHCQATTWCPTCGEYERRLRA